MSLAVDYRWGLAGAMVAGVVMLGFWRAAPLRPVAAPVPDAPRAGTVVPAGEEERVRAALARDPADIDAHLDLARVHLARRDMRAVWAETLYVLKRSPGEPRALTYQALVRFAAGETDRAVKMLEEVVKAAPALDEARRSLAYVYRRAGREDEAAALGVKGPEADTP